MGNNSNKIWENDIDDGNVNNDNDDEDDKVGYITDKFNSYE